MISDNVVKRGAVVAVLTGVEKPTRTPVAASQTVSRSCPGRWVRAGEGLIRFRSVEMLEISWMR